MRRPTNKEAVRTLLDNGMLLGNSRAQADDIIECLVNAGLLEADKGSDAEIIADLAKDWLYDRNSDARTVSNVWSYVSGWSTDSWSTVLEQQGFHISLNGPEGVKKVTEALLILAKEAGVV